MEGAGEKMGQEVNWQERGVERGGVETRSKPS